MRHLALILFLIFSVLCPQAQTDEAYSWSDKGVWPESPKAATIREVTTPLPALLTGAAEFSVPLHTLVAEDFTLPFQFRYHATGMKRRQTDYGAVRGQIAKTADRRYMESFTFNADTLERIEFNGGYFDGHGKAHFLFTDWQGNVTMTTDAGGRLEQHTGYYPYGEPWREPAGQHAKLFAGKERVTGLPGGDYDFGPRGYRATTTLWDSWDIHAADYALWSPWMYCGGNPIRNTDPTGNAWKRVQNEDNDASHFEWVKPQDSYDKNGNLLPGLYEQAILFTKEGSKGEFNPSSKFNIGTSTAIVHLDDGTTKEYDACTYPSDIKKSATIPEGSYEAAVGKHKGNYTALRMSDIGTTNFYSNSIELGEPNPSNSKTTKAVGVNIHKPGKYNLTGTFKQENENGEKVTKHISEGCFLIDRNKWDDFISNFNTTEQKNNIIGISVER
ncbi:MAG: hypothetical protein J6J93_06685 [Muribaculaceae bacterium]|nr:hypothetical protein [Muribaculaceae bacterium]